MTEYTFNSIIKEAGWINLGLTTDAQDMMPYFRISNENGLELKIKIPKGDYSLSGAATYALYKELLVLYPEIFI